MEESLFPFEFWIPGTPLSLQASGRNKAVWIDTVRKAAADWRDAVMPMAFLDQRPVCVTLFYFPAEPMIGDIDNIVKPVLDAMCGGSTSSAVLIASHDPAVAERCSRVLRLTAGEIDEV